MQFFSSDRVLLYDVHPWNDMGFGCPNFGDNVGTLSGPIHALVDYVGQAQLFIMTHVDAQRTQPPSINTVMRICKTVNRVQTVLAGRQKAPKDLLLEEGHSSPSPRIWMIHPVPYFKTDFIRNHWLSEYNNLTMIALTNAMQHSDNNLALTVTEKFAQDIWQYFNEIKMLVGSELLNIDHVTLITPEFQFTQEHYAAYDPSSIILNFEALDTPGPIFQLPTEDDIRPLFRGFPANELLSVIKQYPVLPDMADFSGQLPGEDEHGVDSENTAPPHVTKPQV